MEGTKEVRQAMSFFFFKNAAVSKAARAGDGRCRGAPLEMRRQVAGFASMCTCTHLNSLTYSLFPIS